MRVCWAIDKRDVDKVRAFVRRQSADPLVERRVHRNVMGDHPKVNKSRFWRAMVSCLLTTQQRSGPDTPVTRFIAKTPFPLAFAKCRGARTVERLIRETISGSGGIRRAPTIAKEAATNLRVLEAGVWREMLRYLNELDGLDDPTKERCAARFVMESLSGFGPKQSRNLLQSLRLTKYEIPVDSRVVKWLNEFGFPVTLTATALADEGYYCFVLDSLRDLCEKSDVLPCVLDACIFSSFDKGGWRKGGIPW